MGQAESKPRAIDTRQKFPKAWETPRAGEAEVRYSGIEPETLAKASDKDSEQARPRLRAENTRTPTVHAFEHRTLLPARSYRFHHRGAGCEQRCVRIRVGLILDA